MVSNSLVKNTMAKSIKMKNNVYWDSTAIMHNQKSLSDILGPHIIECITQTTQSPTLRSYINFTNWVKNIQRGNLSVSNGLVKIGKGINLVKVTYTIGIYSANNFLFYAYPTKNGTNQGGRWFVQNHEAYQYSEMNFQAVLEVNENDLISFSTYGELAYQIESGKTTMVVEAIG